jgi:hypothetical protein
MVRQNGWFVRMEFSCNINGKLVNYQKIYIYSKAFIHLQGRSYETTQNY